jgi:hypothetical protein
MVVDKSLLALGLATAILRCAVAVTDASGTTLYFDQGVLIVRKAVGDINLILAGTVKTGPTIVPVGANINLVANIYPAGTMIYLNAIELDMANHRQRVY